MTREEIISNLLYMKRSVKEDTVEDITINEVIKSLKQEPCEDCISRKAVFSLYREHGEVYAADIKSLPPVIPQPKTGHWIEHFDESGKWYECNQCHTDWGGSVNYCPNCGIKMVEPQESEVQE